MVRASELFSQGWPCIWPTRVHYNFTLFTKRQNMSCAQKEEPRCLIKASPNFVVARVLIGVMGEDDPARTASVNYLKREVGPVRRLSKRLTEITLKVGGHRLSHERYNDSRGFLFSGLSKRFFIYFCRDWHTALRLVNRGSI